MWPGVPGAHPKAEDGHCFPAQEALVRAVVFIVYVRISWHLDRFLTFRILGTLWASLFGSIRDSWICIGHHRWNWPQGLIWTPLAEGSSEHVALAAYWAWKHGRRSCLHDWL